MSFLTFNVNSSDTFIFQLLIFQLMAIILFWLAQVVQNLLWGGPSHFAPSKEADELIVDRVWVVS